MNQDIPRDLSSMPSRPKSRKNLSSWLRHRRHSDRSNVARSELGGPKPTYREHLRHELDDGPGHHRTDDFNVTVTNSGGAIGSATIQCVVYIPAADGGNQTNYNTTQVISLGSGVTKMCSIVVNTPFGTTVTTDMCAERQPRLNLLIF